MFLYEATVWSFVREAVMFEAIRSVVRGRRDGSNNDIASWGGFIAHLTDAVLIIDRQADQCISANRAARELFGLDETALRAVPLSKLLPGVERAVNGAETEFDVRLPIQADSVRDAQAHATIVAVPPGARNPALHIVVIKPSLHPGDCRATGPGTGTSRDVERLRAVLDTAWQIGLLQDIGQLASSTAKILNERFAYFHVRVYLEEDSGLVLAAEVGDDAFPMDSAADLMVREAAELKDMVLRDRTGSPITFRELQTTVDLAQMAVPVAAFDELGGAIYIQCAIKSHVTAEDRETVSAIARQFAVGINNLRLREVARQQATNDERRRLARELHDSVAGDLAALLWQTEDLVSQLTSGSDISVDRLKEIRDTIRETLAESRRAVWNLRSETSGVCPLSQLLQGELDSLEKISDITAQLSGGYSGSDLTPEIELALLRIGQEAINNVRRHSGASHVNLSLSKTGRTVTLVVQDDGRGFTETLSDDTQLGGFGLTSMYERALSVGGDLKIESAPGRGTSVAVTVETSQE